MANTYIGIPNLSDDARTTYLIGTMGSVSNGSVMLWCYAGYAFDILAAQFETESGSCRVTLEINNGSSWVAVTGLSSVTVTSGGVTSNATANYTVNAGSKLRITISNNVDAVELAMSIKIREPLA